MNWKQVEGGEIDTWDDGGRPEEFSLMRSLAAENPRLHEIEPGVWREDGGYGNSGPGGDISAAYARGPRSES